MQNIKANINDDLLTGLMLRVSQDDPAAFESLVDQCQTGLIQYFTFLCKDATLAEDLAQEVFIRIYRTRARYQPKAKFKAFMYQIARNLWFDHLRKKKKHGKEVRLVEAFACQAEPSPNNADDNSFDPKALYNAILKLPEKQREVLLLSHIEDMAYADIATCLSVPLGTVKSRVFHAIRKLRALLQTR